MRKKRIRFFINSLGSGGAESVLTDALACLAEKEEYDITLTAVVGGEREDRIPANVHFHCLFPQYRDLRALPVKTALKLPRRLFSLLFLRGDYDYEVAYLEGRPTRFVAAKKTAGKKIAFVHCDLSVKNAIAPLYRNPSRCLEEYKSYDSVCFVSEDAAKGFEKVIGHIDNARVVHNVIDAGRVRAMAAQDPGFRYTSYGLKLIAVGRLASEKNYAMLISVIKELEQRYDLELLIIGDGPEREALTKQIQTDGVRSVRLLGFCDNPYPYIKQADALVCSSLFEGYSTVVCEAVTLGIPVITTKCAGMAELLDNGRFGVITENSAEGLFKGIEGVLLDPGSLKEMADHLASYQPAESAAVREYRDLFDE